MKYKIDTDTESEEEKTIQIKMNQENSTKEIASDNTLNEKNKGKDIEVESTSTKEPVNKIVTPIRDRKISRFNNATETSIKLVGKENYSIWAPEMKNILSMHHLEDYLFEEYLKKVRISEIPAGTLGSYTKIPGDKRRVYDTSVTEEMIDDDKHAKFILDRSVTEIVKRKINFGKYTAYELWNILRNSYNESDGERRRRLKDSLDSMKYERSEDFVIFITNLNETFEELEDLGESFTDQEKFDYLYKMLPQSISVASNMIIYRNKFKDCVEYLSEVVPTIKQLQLEMSMNKGRGTGNLNMSAETNKRRLRKTNKTKQIDKKDRNNTKCFNCGGIGHLARECPSENRHRKNKNPRSKRFGESSYAQATVDKEESRDLNKVFEKNVLIDHNEEIDDESSSAITRTKKKTPRHQNKTQKKKTENE